MLLGVKVCSWTSRYNQERFHAMKQHKNGHLAQRDRLNCLLTIEVVNE